MCYHTMLCVIKMHWTTSNLDSPKSPIFTTYWPPSCFVRRLRNAKSLCTILLVLKYTIPALASSALENHHFHKISYNWSKISKFSFRSSFIMKSRKLPRCIYSYKVNVIGWSYYLALGTYLIHKRKVQSKKQHLDAWVSWAFLLITIEFQ